MPVPSLMERIGHFRLFFNLEKSIEEVCFDSGAGLQSGVADFVSSPTLSK